MSRCCNNCTYSHYFNDSIGRSIVANSNEGIRCDLNGFHTDFNERCKEHKYMKGCEEYKTYVMYDNSYLSPGYFIISELDGEIVKFAKIYSSTNSYQIPHYNVTVFEKNSIDGVEYQYRDIVIKANSGEKLFNVLNNLAIALRGSKVMSIDPANEGKNNLFAKKRNKEAILTFQKDVCGVRKATNFININIGDNMICRQYGPISNFYRDLAAICIKEANIEDVQKILKLTR